MAHRPVEMQLLGVALELAQDLRRHFEGRDPPPGSESRGGLTRSRLTLRTTCLRFSGSSSMSSAGRRPGSHRAEVDDGGSFIPSLGVADDLGLPGFGIEPGHAAF